jgi:hypothetical protein
MHVIQIIGLAAGHPHPYDGQYVVDYDPTPLARGERPILVTTNDIGHARQFDNPLLAFRFWKMDSGATRDDGKPDRPLTAFTVEITKL